MQYLNELYFGKEYLSDAQSLLSSIRRKFGSKNYSYSMNTDSEVLKFNREIEKLFGFESFSLNISPDLDINAYAIPVNIYMTNDERKKFYSSLKAGKSGFKFNKNISAICTLNMGLINKQEFSNEEIMAIMLHEIGHIFFEAVTDEQGKYTLISKLIKILREINKKIIDRITNGKEFNIIDIRKEVHSIFALHPISFNIEEINPKSLINRIFHHESMSDNMRPSMIRYTNEKFADTFATSYGYGVELHTAMDKMTNIVIKAYDIHQETNAAKVAKKVKKLLKEDLKEYIKCIKDEHPDGLTRIKISVDMLKREIAKEGIDPKLKRQMIAELEQMNKLIDDYINFPVDQDSIKITRTYYTILYNEFGGDRREQDADNNALFNTIDNRYDVLAR